MFPALPSLAAQWFLAPVIVICLLAAFNDLKRMKLPNPVVLSLVAVYIVMGPFLLPMEQYLWGFSHGAVMYLVGVFAFAFLGVGAGDGKFAAAMSLYIPLADAGAVLTIFAAMVIVAFLTHRLARAIGPIRRATPDWTSWEHKKFPLGIALAPTMILYLALIAFR